MQFDKNLLESLNIVDWGYTSEALPHSFNRFRDWIEQKKFGPLNYLADHRKKKRASLKKVFPQFKSALVFLFSYNDTKSYLEQFYRSNNSNKLKVASYSLGFKGEDYHHSIKDGLNTIIDNIKLSYPNIKTSISLDVHPVLERDLAYRAGLGWFGKNSMFINKKHGSFFMIGAVLCSEYLPIQTMPLDSDHCGNCRACVDACPTDAIDQSTRTIISNKCISTFTIELFKEAIPPDNFPYASKGEIFGCDICQDVCPWNSSVINVKSEMKIDLDKRPLLKKIMAFFLSRPIKEIKEELLSWSNRRFKREFSKTAYARTGRIGMLKNLKIYK